MMYCRRKIRIYIKLAAIAQPLAQDFSNPVRLRRLPQVTHSVLTGRSFNSSKARWEKSSPSASSQAMSTSQAFYRETDVIRLLAQAKSNEQISSILGIATRTAETHRARIMMKLRVHSLIELVRYADIHGIK
jgi:DNA-binding NarL/FixJ family response regulator